MSHKVIVFDIDGTIAETAKYWLPVLKVMVAEIEKKYSIQNEFHPIENAVQLLGQTDRVVLGKFFPDRSEAEYKEFLTFSNEIWKKFMPQHPFQLYDGTLEVFQWLKKEGWKIFLSSNCDSFYLNEVITQCDLKPWISGAACAEEYPGFSKYEFTTELLMPYHPYEGFFIGDSDHDMKAGRENGLQTIHAKYGYATVHHPELVDYSVSSIREILEIVAGL